MRKNLQALFELGAARLQERARAEYTERSHTGRTELRQLKVELLHVLGFAHIALALSRPCAVL